MTEYPQIFRFRKTRSDEFKNTTKSININSAIQPNYHDLQNDNLCEPVKGTAKLIVPEERLNKLDIAKIIFKALKPAIDKGIPYEEMLDDRGMWEWLSIAFWQHIGIRGNTSGGDIKRYSPQYNGESDWVRHLLRTAVWLYEQFENDEKSLSVFLKIEPNKGGDLTETWTQNKAFLCEGVTHVLFELYFDEKNECLRNGLANKELGDHRHLMAFLKQLRATSYIEDMKKDDLINLLPNSFERFTNRNN